jgi:hypothetical protein
MPDARSGLDLQRVVPRIHAIHDAPAGRSIFAKMRLLETALPHHVGYPETQNGTEKKLIARRQTCRVSLA